LDSITFLLFPIGQNIRNPILQATYPYIRDGGCHAGMLNFGPFWSSQIEKKDGEGVFAMIGHLNGSIKKRAYYNMPINKSLSNYLNPTNGRMNMKRILGLYVFNRKVYQLRLVHTRPKKIIIHP